jgi:rhodanese-related sulfurtransferase
MKLIQRLFGRSGGPADLRPARVQARLTGANPPLVLDVRNLDEYRASHIPGASLLPISELGRRLGELPRDREIICVCSFGRNSDSVAQVLAGAGFKSHNLSGGMVAWQRAGLPVRKGIA